ncbi:C2 family cysteine protease [Humisphaera borealis]|uniref:Calpain catalytic domain-containing protein n=1 Tax=Humisphaera borealis TaxID=2807512 RepID=A0A7M2WYZ9_9BACT|nr:C2 family cysteine protease [Humisphaera borealis]QOV90728.1 hypothetical protein IPV69_05045 [Humisphaera borealis]
MKTASARRESSRLAAAVLESLEDRRHFNVTVNGTAGNDVINVSQQGSAIKVTLNGVTTTYANQPVFAVTVNGLAGNDQIAVSELITIPAFLNGGDGNDTLKGGNGPDTLDGGAGNDLLRGSGGGDTLRGMSGDDTLLGGFGDDILYGGQGNDYVDGEQDNDYVNGNGQADPIGPVIINANLQRVTFSTGSTAAPSPAFSTASTAMSLTKTTSVSYAIFYTDNDTCRGGDGNDTIEGMGGTDAVYGDGGDDVVYGNAGNDRVYGGAGNNFLLGGDGDDVLVSIGGGTSDRLWGEKGIDSFWMDDARTTELNMDGDTAEYAGSNFHFVSQFENNVIRNNGQTLQERPSKVLVGQNLMDPIALAPYVSFRDRPLFGAAGIRMNDIRQGDVGDCYFVGGLSATAKVNANRIRQSVVDLGDGTYAVRFFRSGVASYYRVDGDLPAVNGTPKYAKLGNGNSIWVAIMEKAFAYHRYFDGGTYAILELGRSSEPFDALAAQNADFWGTSGTNVLASIASQMNQGRAVVASSINALPNGLPYVNQHLYVVNSVDTAGGTITVRNPWGYDGAGNDANPQDGYYTFTASQFFTYFKKATWAKV